MHQASQQHVLEAMLRYNSDEQKLHFAEETDFSKPQ